ncbi:MAG: BatD family protein [Elusimicrobiota bacterium]
MKIGKFLSFLLLLNLTSNLFAEPQVSAKVSANDIPLNGTITLTLELSGVNNVSGPETINIPGFQVDRAGSAQSFQFINGQMSSFVAFNYLLTPLKVGVHEIPSISLNYESKTYSTQAIKVNVRESASRGGLDTTDQGSASVQVPAEGLKPVFMTAVVNDDKVYVGQQILLKVQFLRRPDVGITSQPKYTEPNLTGFLVESFPQKQYMTTINGAQYEVTELPYAIFPTSDGELAIGSASLELGVRGNQDPFDPNSFFDSFFGRGKSFRLSTRAIPVRVKALPKNKPSLFSGAVGRFKVYAKTDVDQFEVGKPFNLILTIEGVGNIKTLKEPVFPEFSGFRKYETISNSKIDKDGKFLSGTKEFKIPLIPQVSGELKIPAIGFSFFNPAIGDYTNESTEEMKIKVNQGNLTNEEVSTALPYQSQAPHPEGIQVIDNDIRFIKSGDIWPATSLFLNQGWFYLINFLPPLFALAAFLVKKRGQLRSVYSDHFRTKEAIRTAKKKLKQSLKTINDSDPIPFYSSIQLSLMGYLADKFKLSPSGIIWEDIEKRLKEKVISENLIFELRNLLDQADMARFATSSFDDSLRMDIYTQSNALIEGLEKELGK